MAQTGKAVTKIGKYSIESILGEGAMGVVYKAYDHDLNQPVGIKTLRSQTLAGGTQLADLQTRFRHEAIAGRRLRHRNIVAIYEFGVDEGCCYIVMEYIEGTPLKDLLAQGRRFELSEAKQIIEQILDALDEAHRQGVIHRDIKPANIMLKEGFQVLVTDFGIAKLESSELTRTGTLMGTPNYMSPEQWQGGQVDGRTDLFSTGVILYELLTGEKPFDGSSPQSIMQKVFTSTPMLPSEINVHLPRACDAIVKKALARRPEDRYQSAAEFKRALLAIIGGSLAASEAEQTLYISDAPPTVAPSRGSDLRQKSGRGIVIGGGVALVAALAIGYTAYRMTDVSEPAVPTDEPPAVSEVTSVLESSQDEPESQAVPAPPRPVLDPATLDALLATFTCAQLSGDVDPEHKVSVRGHVRPQDRAVLQQRLAELEGVIEVDTSKVKSLIWPYCELEPFLAKLRRNMNAHTQLDSTSSIREYVEGDPLEFGLNAPSYEAYLYVDYFQIDGNVVHVLPTQRKQHRRYPAGDRIKIGDRAKGETRFEVGAPFGTELITVVASKEPLFAEPRVLQESAHDYLTALHEAIARSDKHWVTADYFYINTKAAPTANR